MSAEARAGIAGLRRRFAEGEATPRDAVEESLARIERLDPEVHAFRSVFAAEAREAARESTEAMRRGEDRGPLHGVPFAAKELFDVEGAVINCGSAAYRDRVGERDAAAVARLREAGAILVGLTRSHEFAFGISMQHEADGTRNPWNLERTPGGSSGGSGAAVAAGMVPLALGTDTGGSVRIPAAFCGIVGLKPTFDAIDPDGVAPMAATVDDVALAWEVLADRLPAPGTSPPKVATSPAMPTPPTEPPASPRVAVAPAMLTPPPTPAIQAAVDDALATLVDAGYTPVEVEIDCMAEARAVMKTIARAEIGHVHRHLYGTFPGRRDIYTEQMWDILERTPEVSAEDYVAARYAGLEIQRRLRRQFLTFDVLLGPVAPTGPPTVADPDHVEHEGRRVSASELIPPARCQPVSPPTACRSASSSPPCRAPRPQCSARPVRSSGRWARPWRPPHSERPLAPRLLAGDRYGIVVQSTGRSKGTTWRSRRG
jgi:aspartyl-tRNA(Asn)/glutamyl-tRNA(Gln) amidotransferase subunit A